MKPISEREVLRLHLAGWANQMAARFGAPVYLVGSALTEPDPRDIDVRVVLSDAAFEARYGVLPQHADRDSWGQWGAGSRRWGEDMAKINAQVCLALRRNIDFQVQAELIAWHRGFDKLPRVRLDTLTLPEASTPLPVSAAMVDLCDEDLVTLIYASFDALLRGGEFEICDRLLVGAPDTLPTLALLALLSITHAARDKLEGRKTFARRVRARLTRDDPARVTALLAGLDDEDVAAELCAVAP